MVNKLIPIKVTLYRHFLRMLSYGEMDQNEYKEIVDLIDKAKSFEELNCICDKFQIVPF